MILGKRSMRLFMVVLAGISGIYAAETCTAIDAVSSASKKFNIKTGSQYCETTAKLVWQDGYDNGTRFIEWGTSTQYGKKNNLTGFSGTVTISNLAPNTKYYWRVNRVWQGRDYLLPTGSFTTTPSTGITNNISVSKQTSLQIQGTYLNIPYNNEKTFTVSLYSINGALIQKQIVPVNAAVNMVNVNKKLSGSCICVVGVGSRIITTSMISIR